MFSNRYIFIYSTILVVVVAVVLAFAATSLKPFQDQNVRIEKIQNLLKAANIESTTKNAEELYATYVKEELAIDAEGTVVSRFFEGKLEGNIRPFNINLKEQQTLRKKGESAIAPVYVLKKDGTTAYIIPMLGNGLWGSISGNIALADDFNTIVGVTFDHASETPGLGAEIVTEGFRNRFLNKQLFEGEEFVSVTVKKAANKDSLHEVDALSGGTITSEGVSNMLKNDLSFYKGFKKELANKETGNE